MKNSYNIIITHFGIDMIKNFGELIKRVNAINLNFSPYGYGHNQMYQNPYSGPYGYLDDEEDNEEPIEFQEFVAYDRILYYLEDRDTYTLLSSLSEMPESFMAALSQNCEASNFHNLCESIRPYWHDWLDNFGNPYWSRKDYIDPKVMKRCKDKLINELSLLSTTHIKKLIGQISKIKG